VISPQEMESFVTEAVKLSFQDQFGVHVIERLANPDEAYKSMGKVLGAKLVLSCVDYCYDLYLFVPVMLSVRAMSDLLSEIFAEEDTEVWESVGEFLNIISGCLCKNINSHSKKKFELQCPTFFPRMAKFDPKLLYQTQAMTFDSNLGPFVFAYRNYEIQEGVREARG
jgi:hypothetical protein